MNAGDSLPAWAVVLLVIFLVTLVALVSLAFWAPNKPDESED